MEEDGKKVALYSTLLNVVLVFLKSSLAVLSGSSAIMAEAIHSFTDVIGSMTVLIGISISKRKSPSFPWGLYKAENIAAIVSAFFVLLMAYELGKNIFPQETKEIANRTISMAVLSLMTVPVFLFAKYEKKKAEALNSPGLLADAKNWMADIAPLSVVIIGFASSAIYPSADKIASAIIIVFIVKSAYDIVKDSMKSLLDASVNAETIEKMRMIVNNFNEVEEITELNARNSGRFIFVLLNLRLSIKKLKEAHDAADRIERAIKKEIPFVDRVTIHYEPERRQFIRYAVSISDRKGAISEHFGNAPLIALWGKEISDGNIFSWEILDNPFLHMEKGKGIRLAEYLVERKVDVLYLKKPFEGKGPEYVFSNSGVEVRITEKETIKQLMHDMNLINKSLEV
jgi:cation diffusion facilitator family transporter